MLQLTEVSDADGFATFRELLHEYARKDLADPQHSSIWKDIEQLPGRYAAPQGCVLLAHWNGELAGCGAFVPCAQGGMAEIKRVYVRSGLRQRGIARALTVQLLARAQSALYRRAAISTWSDNGSALPLYRQLGFAPIAQFKEHSSERLIYLGLDLPSAGAFPTD